MPVFIHKPLATQEELQGLIDTRAPETNHLDFKAVFWKQESNSEVPPEEEATKDVAAFANADGGDIVIGIGEQNHRANEWCPTPGTRGKQPVLEGWLQRLLYPSQVAETVRIQEKTFVIGGREQHAMVVSVPPWPHSVVGVRVEIPRRNRLNTFYFPFRVDDDTKNVTLDEAMQRSNAAQRATYLQALQAYESNSAAVVQFGSPVWVDVKSEKYLTFRPEQDPFTLGEPSRERLLVKCKPSTYRDGAILIDVPAGDIVVPYELVKALWNTPDGKVQLVLDAVLLRTLQKVWVIRSEQAVSQRAPVR